MLGVTKHLPKAEQMNRRSIFGIEFDCFLNTEHMYTGSHKHSTTNSRWDRYQEMVANLVGILKLLLRPFELANFGQ